MIEYLKNEENTIVSPTLSKKYCKYTQKFMAK